VLRQLQANHSVKPGYPKQVTLPLSHLGGSAALVCGSTTAGNRRKYTAKTAKEPYWPQSKSIGIDLPWPSAGKSQPSADKHICRTAENRSLNRVSGEGSIRSDQRVPNKVLGPNSDKIRMRFHRYAWYCWHAYCQHRILSLFYHNSSAALSVLLNYL